MVEERKLFNERLHELRTRGAGGHRSKTTLKDLKIGRVLGEGNYGKVMVTQPTVRTLLPTMFRLSLPRFLSCYQVGFGS